MVARVVVRAGARIAKKAYSKSKTGKKSATRKTLQARADRRAAAVKRELAERRAVKKAASDRAWSDMSGNTRMTKRKPPGAAIGPRKRGVQKRTADPAAMRERSKQQFLAREAAKSDPVSRPRPGRKPIPPISKPKSGTTKNLSGQVIYSAKDKALMEATKKKAAARKAASARRRRAAAVGAVGAAGAAAQRRRTTRRATPKRSY